MIARSPHSARDRMFEIDLHKPALARRNGAGAEHREPADHVLGAEMKMHRQPVAQRGRRGARHGDAEIDPADRLMQGRIDHPVAAPGFAAFRKAAGKVQRTPFAGAGAFDRPVMRVNPRAPAPRPRAG